MTVAQPYQRASPRWICSSCRDDDPGPDHGAGAVRSFCADLPALIRAVEFRELEAGLSCVMGIGSDAWDRLFGPASGRTSPVPRVPGRIAPSNRDAGRPVVPYPRQADGSVLRDGGADHGEPRRCGHSGRRGHGFRYFDDRDLLGLRRRHRESARASGDRRRAHRRRGSRVRRRQLRDHAEISARYGRLERAAHRGAGTHHRPHQARPTSNSTIRSSRHRRTMR